MTRSKALQLEVAAAFAAVALGSVGAAGYVPLALWRFNGRSQGSLERYAEGTRELAEIRGCVREVRAAALQAFHAPSEGRRDAQETMVSFARAQCASLIEAYSAHMTPSRPVPDPAPAEWRHFLTSDVPEHDAAVDAVLAASRAPARDPAVLQRLFAAAADGDATLEKMVALHSSSAKAEASRIHGSLQRLAYVYVVLTAMGGLGAIVLLVESLRLVRRFTRSADERLADLDAFAGHVSHDLRGPLQSIRLSVAAIARRTQDPDVQRLATSAETGVQRLDRMIRDLLQFARGGAVSPGSAGEGITDVSAVVRETCDALRPHAERIGANVTVETDPSARARVAPVALQTIVANLVENALKYGTGEHANEVVVTTSSVHDEVRIAVRDHGPGMRPELLRHVFEPFVRGTDRADSYGLGLATVKRLVDELRGTITVESAEGRGATFVVTLPAARPPGRNGRPAASGAPAAPPPGARP